MSTNTNQQNTNANDWKAREIGALWQRTDRFTGKVTIEGKTYDIVAFSNKFKKADNQPDFRVYLSVPNNPTSPPSQPSKSNSQPSKTVTAPQPQESGDTGLL